MLRGTRPYRIPSGTESHPLLASKSSNGRVLKRSRLVRAAIQLLGKEDLPPDHALGPYRQEAVNFRDAHIAELAQTVGGGECGNGVSSIVTTASLQMAVSRWLFDQGMLAKDMDMLRTASKMGNNSTQNLLAAHELCARNAAAREVVPLDLASIIASSNGHSGG